ncbi:hypothetical protein R3P38DRAFT_2783782 [Favolaschia claudopus]|uniref:Uncharacterized protein n=1 Tax=Favolaschia claudopus TaxID=2862362 RepID=A0AAW0B170_9AGAR
MTHQIGTDGTLFEADTLTNALHILRECVGCLKECVKSDSKADTYPIWAPAHSPAAAVEQPKMTPFLCISSPMMVSTPLDAAGDTALIDRLSLQQLMGFCDHLYGDGFAASNPSKLVQTSWIDPDALQNYLRKILLPTDVVHVITHQFTTHKSTRVHQLKYLNNQIPTCWPVQKIPTGYILDFSDSIWDEPLAAANGCIDNLLKDVHPCAAKDSSSWCCTGHYFLKQKPNPGTIWWNSGVLLNTNNTQYHRLVRNNSRASSAARKEDQVIELQAKLDTSRAMHKESMAMEKELQAELKAAQSNKMTQRKSTKPVVVSSRSSGRVKTTQVHTDAGDKCTLLASEPNINDGFATASTAPGESIIDFTAPTGITMDISLSPDAIPDASRPANTPKFDEFLSKICAGVTQSSSALPHFGYASTGDGAADTMAPFANMHHPADHASLLTAQREAAPPPAFSKLVFLVFPSSSSGIVAIIYLHFSKS